MVTEFWDSLLKQDLSRALKLIGEVYLAGVDLKHFAERCLEELRLLYLIAVAKEAKQTVTADTLDISPVHFTNLQALLGSASVLQLERMAQILGKAISQLPWASLPRFVLEMAAVRMSKLQNLAQIEKNLMEGVAAPAETTPPTASARPPMSSPAKPAARSTAPVPPPAPTAAAPVKTAPAAAPDGTWKGFVEAVMKKRPLLGALISHANFKIENGGEGKVITLAFEPKSFYDREANNQKNDITEHVKAFFGKQAVTVFSNEVKSTSPSLEAERAAEVASITKSALENPTVKQMKEVLGADVVAVQVDR
jgi:DNA polymerase III gamma/tau subunit